MNNPISSHNDIRTNIYNLFKNIEHNHKDIRIIGVTLSNLVNEEVTNISFFEYIKTIENNKNFQRFLGGSPTHVAVNATRLGLNVALVGTGGNDGLGDFIVGSLKSNNVNTTYFRNSISQPSSVIFVSKSKETPEFIPFRHADCEILEEQLPDELLANAKIFHTTCFALSKEPARTTILNSAKKAKELGLQLSIDIKLIE